MQIPNEVLIGPFKYKVERPEVLYNDNGQQLWGQIDYRRQTIRVIEDAHAEALEETLLHEVLHGIFDNIGRDIDEDTNRALSIALYDTLRRNDWLK